MVNNIICSVCLVCLVGGDRLKESIYTDFDQFQACFKRLNATMVSFVKSILKLCFVSQNIFKPMVYPPNRSADNLMSTDPFCH